MTSINDVNSTCTLNMEPHRKRAPLVMKAYHVVFNATTDREDLIVGTLGGLINVNFILPFQINTVYLLHMFTPYKYKRVVWAIGKGEKRQH